MKCTAPEDIVVKEFQENGFIAFTRRNSHDAPNVKPDTALASLVESKVMNRQKIPIAIIRQDASLTQTEIADNTFMKRERLS